MTERQLILRTDESAPVNKKMVQDIASAINRALFHQNAPAHIKIMNVTWDAKGVITAITHPNVTVEMGQKYCYIIITAARMVDKAVVHFEENES